MGALATALGTAAYFALNIILLAVLVGVIIGLIKIAFKLFLGGLAIAIVVTVIYFLVQFGTRVVEFLSPYMTDVSNAMTSALK